MNIRVVGGHPAGYHEDGSDMSLRNAGNHLQNHMESQFKTVRNICYFSLKCDE
jgi:hypothetical protein